MSCANTATPSGGGQGAGGPPNALSRTSRADEAAVPVNQWTETSVRMRSTLTTDAGSVHSVNFSAIHASCPTGESFSAYDTVCGRLA